MLRWLLVLSVGCGRVGFDERVAGDASGNDGPIAFDCPATYTMFMGHCYRVAENTGEFDWAVNEGLCEADAPTAHLVVIDDQAEHDVVLQVLADNTIVDAAVGFSDRITEGTYLNVTGGPAFIVFASNEPDGDGEDCGGIDQGPPTGIEDIACDNANDYICEVDGFFADPSAF